MTINKTACLADKAHKHKVDAIHSGDTQHTSPQQDGGTEWTTTASLNTEENVHGTATACQGEVKDTNAAISVIQWENQESVLVTAYFPNYVEGARTTTLNTHKLLQS